MNKKVITIILNIVLIVLEIIGLVMTFRNLGWRESIKYYTELSNILGLLSSILLVCFLLSGKVPRSVKLFRFISVLSLSVTFLVVLFVLGPMYGFDYKFLLFSGSMLFSHLLCPILMFISFIFLEEGKFEKGDCLIANALTIIYAIVMITLNILNKVDGPYPFLRVRHQNIFASIIWIILIVGGSYWLSRGIRKLKERY